nr:cell division protein FtsA [uncultured archaeon]
MFFPKKMIGVDIGTSSVKVVEISRWGEGKTLENYGEIKSEYLYKESLSNTQKGSYLLSNNVTSEAIRGILEEAKIKTKEAIFSIPDFSTFCTSFDIPFMTEKEIPEAIRYNASQYITLPISEVTLDWKIMPNSPGSKNSSFGVFLLAVPNQVIQEYQAMAKMAGLQLYALEAEALGITRALIRNNKKIVCLVDIGVQSSTINIIEKGFLKKSYSFTFNSSQLSNVVSSGLGVALDQAENIKNKEGLLHPRSDVVKTLYLLLSPLLIEIKGVCAEFLHGGQKQIDEIFLTGGTANLPGLKEYFAESLKKEVYVPNCFSEFLYPPILDQTLKIMAPRFSAATGVALGGLEK